MLDTQRIISAVDRALNTEDYTEAERILLYWAAEAKSNGDLRGEAEMQNELMGLYRKTGSRLADDAVARALELLPALGDTVAAATMLINAATTLCARGRASEGLPLFERAEKIYALSVSDGLRMAGLYNNYGLALSAVGDRDGALEKFNTALNLLKDTAPLEKAITILNIADLYNPLADEEYIHGLCEQAYRLLCGEDIVHDGYFAFVCRKCAPVFGYYGFFDVKSRLLDLAEASV